ncbi:hypothetical protein [Schnuerera sp.]|uniref:hypothetical protein n=1 Tax=Schnuerera sp. TaxID=2794844 RepID=UPI002CE6D367|nr:hypothetical protein [Schnuerera sp.]HSH35235.1 hypothetical protein [Schnuerera sp.]
MKTCKDIHDVLDKALDDLDSGQIDNDRAGQIARLTGNKISAGREQIKYKKLTNNPDKIAFFED